MTARAGTYEGGELWLRCPFCGDSQYHQQKAHFSITPEGLYHCLRCGAGGRLSAVKTLRLYAEAGVSSLTVNAAAHKKADWAQLHRELIPGPGLKRPSALARYHLPGQDVFLVRDTQGTVWGLCLVDIKTKKKVLKGSRGLGWVGDRLTSSLESPLRLVEGPYDVLGPRDVCCYGSLQQTVLRQLTGHFLILCPDGDVWAERGKVRQLYQAVVRTQSKVFVVGVEILPPDKDPDEVPYSKRKYVEVQEWTSRLSKVLRGPGRPAYFGR